MKYRPTLCFDMIGRGGFNVQRAAHEYWSTGHLVPGRTERNILFDCHFINNHSHFETVLFWKLDYFSSAPPIALLPGALSGSVWQEDQLQMTTIARIASKRRAFQFSRLFNSLSVARQVKFASVLLWCRPRFPTLMCTNKAGMWLKQK